MTVAISFIIFLFGVVPMLTILNAWVLTVIWGWFIVPAFGVTPLAMTTAIGISILAGMLTHQETNTKGEPGQTYAEVLVGITAKSISESLSVLLIGWITTLFM